MPPTQSPLRLDAEILSRMRSEVTSRSLDVEIARLRDLNVTELRSHWQGIRTAAPPHLARHLLFRTLAYRLQADRLGDLEGEAKRLLDRPRSPDEAGQDAVRLSRRTAVLRPGTILAREWNGQMQQVAVLADGFAWNGKTYPSLSKAAFAITGTRWNGPKFFGLRTSQRRRPHHEISEQTSHFLKSDIGRKRRRQLSVPGPFSQIRLSPLVASE